MGDYIRIINNVNQEKVLSIIIAAYNVEQYISEAVDSLLVDEIIDKLDIIIVNDGSTDRTRIIAEQYVAKYHKSIRLINKENAGHGSAINAGISASIGRYIRILDGDDWLDSKELLRFVNDIENIDVDMIITNYKTHNVGDDSEIGRRYSNINYDEICKFDDVCKKGVFFAFHSIIYNRRVFDENDIIKIDEYSFYVDLEYIFYPMPFVETVFFLEGYLYTYRLGNQHQSVSTNNYRKNNSQHKQVILNVARYIKANYGGISDERRYYFIRFSAYKSYNYLLVLFKIFNTSMAIAEFSDFDRKLKCVNPDVYRSLLKIDSTILVMRASGYSFVGGHIYYAIRKIRAKLAIRTRIHNLLSRFE